MNIFTAEYIPFVETSWIRFSRFADSSAGADGVDDLCQWLQSVATADPACIALQQFSSKYKRCVVLYFMEPNGWFNSRVLPWCYSTSLSALAFDRPVLCRNERNF